MSKFAQKVKNYYDRGIWTESMVCDAYAKGRITIAELTAILGVEHKAEVMEAIGSNPTKAALLEVCEGLGIQADASMTKAEILAMIEGV